MGNNPHYHPYSKFLADVRLEAKKFGWVEIDHQENIYMISFSQGTSRINIYYSTMTVATVLDHPKHGRNQMWRRNVHFNALCAILKNPRTHTQQLWGIKGYHVQGKHLDRINRENSIPPPPRPFPKIEDEEEA